MKFSACENLDTGEGGELITAEFLASDDNRRQRRRGILIARRRVLSHRNARAWPDRYCRCDDCDCRAAKKRLHLLENVIIPSHW
ncbi:hypothetical protein [Sinorhizobium medicae]